LADHWTDFHLVFSHPASLKFNVYAELAVSPCYATAATSNRDSVFINLFPFWWLKTPLVVNLQFPPRGLIFGFKFMFNNGLGHRWVLTLFRVLKCISWFFLHTAASASQCRIERQPAFMWNSASHCASETNNSFGEHFIALYVMVSSVLSLII
jgi:hypothetical protein